MESVNINGAIEDRNFKFIGEVNCVMIACTGQFESQICQPICVCTVCL